MCKIGQKKGLIRAVYSTGIRKALVQGSEEVVLQR